MAFKHDYDVNLLYWAQTCLQSNLREGYPSSPSFQWWKSSVSLTLFIGGSTTLVEVVSYIYLVLRSEVWCITYCKYSPPGRWWEDELMIGFSSSFEILIMSQVSWWESDYWLLYCPTATVDTVTSILYLTKQFILTVY